ncbi:RING-H2 finger protein ATL16-like [Amaranthus tricolor]|uniref:RING-H2 finger protein ATL16-like n=1 Tax=Amaranthus tricolor TaxID=29722 RepID=UPI0025873ED7|nr:RING-H2 finger protein ATL16-like [Amaranthus tricolor]
MASSFTNFQQGNNTQTQPNHTSNSDFPIAIALLAIMAIAILLVSYYIFVIKCCLNWQNLDPLRRFSISRASPRDSDHMGSLIAFSPMMDGIHHRGLDEFLLNNIPSIQYKANQPNPNGLRHEGSVSFRGCSVCLSPFEEKEMLRVLPRCKHTFHLDCIDVWLLNNASCPLCRSSISGRTKYPIDHIIAPSSSPQEMISPYISGNLSMVNFNGDDQDYLVIELGEEDHHRDQVNNSTSCNLSTLQSQRKLDYKKLQLARKLQNFSIMGDECINIRLKDEQFEVQQPIRRSFSMDSAQDHGLILQVQEIVRKNHRPLVANYNGVNSINEECNNGSIGRVRRPSFFSFGHGNRSRSSSILPIECDR